MLVTIITYINSVNVILKLLYMKKIQVLSAMMVLALGASAQDTYQSANIATPDLNGTAKYVGMGGAMEALGGDISTINSNPAGIGLFRHSWLGLSGGMTFQGGSLNGLDGSKSKVSFDQVGFVISSPDAEGAWNVAFSYNKSRNFNHILNAANKLDGRSSQNIVTYNKLLADNDKKLNERQINQIDWMLSDGLLYTTTGSGKDDYMYFAAGASDFAFNQKHTGYIGNYAVNISGSIENRFFLGLTVGLKDVHYNSYSEYTENLVDFVGESLGPVTITDNRKITGTGFDVAIGAIYRPIEDSPFRFGATIQSPTFYTLTSENVSLLYNGTELGDFPASLNMKGGVLQPVYRSSENYKFKLYTPWRFGFSLAHTVGNYLALGASIDYASYGSLDNRYDYGDNGYWNDYSYSSSSESDVPMNNATKKVLNGVTTIKLGAEYKPVANVAVRAGYNYVSPMYKTSATKDGYVDSDGQAISSQTAWTNWGATNRFTCGVGFRLDKWNLDLAYQYSTQKGDFYAFESEYYNNAGHNAGYLDNTCPVTKVENNRSQLLLSLGYTF